MESISSMTIINSGCPNEVYQYTCLINSKPTSIDGQIINENMRIYDNTINNLNFDYYCSNDNKYVIIELKEGNIYKYLNNISEILDEGCNQFLIGNHLFSLQNMKNDYTLKYRSIENSIEKSEKLDIMQKYCIGRIPTSYEDYKGRKIDDDLSASRYHAFLKFNDGNWNIIDNNSSNGVYMKIMEKQVKIEWHQLLRLSKDCYCYFSNE